MTSGSMDLGRRVGAAVSYPHLATSPFLWYPCPWEGTAFWGLQTHLIPDP